jgi:hypothetical protein
MGEFELPDFSDPDAAPPEDPFGGKGIGDVIDNAGDVASKAVLDVNPPAGIAEDVTQSLSHDVGGIIQEKVMSIPTADGGLSKGIQAQVLDQLSDPLESQSLANRAMFDAIEERGGIAENVSPDDVKQAYEKEVSSQVDKVTEQLKTGLSDAVDKSLNGTGATAADGTPGKAVLDQLVDNPNKAATDISTKTAAEEPNWKEKVKTKLGDLGNKILKYGGYSLLVLGIAGAFIPGAAKPIDKLAGLAGGAADKVVTAAAQVAQSFLGPLESQIAAGISSFFDGIKTPLIVAGVILLALAGLYMIKKFKEAKNA